MPDSADAQKQGRPRPACPGVSPRPWSA